MSLSLSGFYIFFILGASFTLLHDVVCGGAAALVHYFFLVFFTWTTVEAVWLYVKLVKVFNTRNTEQGYIWKTGLPAWSEAPT